MVNPEGTGGVYHASDSVGMLCPNIHCPHRAAVERSRHTSLQLVAANTVLQENTVYLTAKCDRLEADLRANHQQLQQLDAIAARESAQRSALEKELSDLRRNADSQWSAEVEAMRQERSRLIEQIVQLQGALEEMVQLNESLQHALRCPVVGSSASATAPATVATDAESPKVLNESAVAALSLSPLSPLSSSSSSSSSSSPSLQSTQEGSRKSFVREECNDIVSGHEGDGEGKTKTNNEKVNAEIEPVLKAQHAAGSSREEFLAMDKDSEGEMTAPAEDAKSSVGYGVEIQEMEEMREMREIVANLASMRDFINALSSSDT